MSIQKVELHCAYQWDCEECGKENFCRAVIVEMTPEDRAEMRKRHGGDDEGWETGNWMTRPDEVTCSSCNAVFETVENGEDDEDE